MQTIHKTVLLKETVEALNLKEGAVVVDATLGGGGHSRLVLEKIGKSGTLIAFDQDNLAIDRFKKEFKGGSIKLFNDNFSMLKDRLSLINISSVDAILADLGISSDQLGDPHYGMSFQADGALDMRMDKRNPKTAEIIVNSYSENELADILKKYADERYAKRIAGAIIRKRSEKRIMTTLELVDVIRGSIPAQYAHQKIHFATRTFQALRIEVNEELTVLEEFLAQAVDVLKKGGYLSVITFHSGEDILVKKFFRENARGCICPPQLPLCVCNNKARVRLVTKKPIVPSTQEIIENPRSRSAKLRVLEKIV
jgi:16S rRNA (cytosine1402-N4)-methyltransferase